MTYSIIVDGNTAQVFTDKDNSMAPYAFSWLPTNTPVYFKAGNYLQSSGSSSKRGSVVKITALSTSHRG